MGERHIIYVRYDGNSKKTASISQRYFGSDVVKRIMISEVSLNRGWRSSMHISDLKQTLQPQPVLVGTAELLGCSTSFQSLHLGLCNILKKKNVNGIGFQITRQTHDDNFAFTSLQK